MGRIVGQRRGEIYPDPRIVSATVIDNSIVSRTTVGPTSAHRAVKQLADGRVTYCDATVDGDEPLYLGITLTATSGSDLTNVQVANEIVEPSWTWTPGKVVFCGPAGVLTQIFDPSWAWSRIVGVAFGSTRLWIRFQPAIVQV